MAFDVSTGTTSINYGSTLKIGYRVYGSTGAFTYLTYYPSFNELPYTFTVPFSGQWEIEYTEICPTCGQYNYSDPQTTSVTV